VPHFEEFYASKLRGSLGVADAESILDLRGAERAQGVASVEVLIESSRFGPAKSVAVLLDPPRGIGDETLFQPVGRLLLAAKRAGTVDRLQTLPARDGLGFYVHLTGRAP
jgi:hypothetical protein